MLAFDQNGRIPLPAEGQRYWAPHLLPANFNPFSPDMSVIVEALYAKENQLGIAVFTVTAQESAVCDALRGLISSAIQTVLLIEQKERTEQELANRANELETAAQVSIATATILNSHRLLQTVVDLIHQHFRLHHVQIVLLDENQVLRLAAGSGHIGQQMLATGYQISLHQSTTLLARAARQRQGLMETRPAVGGAVPHEQLAISCTEMALPLIVGDSLIGVLDLYALERERFTPENLRIHTILAAQVAAALENARQYERTQQTAQRIGAVLQESEGRFLQVFHASPVAMAISSMENGRYRDVNESFLHIFGYQRHEVIGHTADELQTWATPAERQVVLQTLQERGSVQQMEVQYRMKSGKIGYALTAIEIVEIEEQPYLFSMFHDITTRKQAEKERESLIQELESKNAELERFTYTVSHDLKSPLVTIRGFLGMLEKDLAKGETEQIIRDISFIRQATDTMQDLLQDLLHLSRLGRVQNTPVAVSFTELAQEAAQRVAGQIAQRGVLVNITPDLPIVLVDRARLVEALQNLIDNGVKFMGSQPHPQIDIGVQLRDNETVFFVRDNGLGIEKTYQDKIFGLFERLETTVEGTGVGLALVKRIIEGHHGRVWVESPGLSQGSTFCLTLPEVGPDK